MTYNKDKENKTPINIIQGSNNNYFLSYYSIFKENFKDYSQLKNYIVSIFHHKADNLEIPF